MASLVERHGWYYAQFYAKHQIPQKKQVPLSTRTRRTALTLLRRMENDVALGLLDPWRMDHAAHVPVLRTLSEATAAFLDAKAHLRPDTVRCYASVLRLFAQHLAAELLRVPDVPLAALTPLHVQSFLSALTAGDVTRKTYLRQLRVFSSWLVKHKALKSDLTTDVQVRRVPDRFPKYFTPDDLARLLVLLHASPLHAWLADVVEVTAYLGLRLGEVCALRWGAVDFEARTLLVANSDGFATKSGKERVLPIPDAALVVLRRRHAEDDQARHREAFVFHAGGGEGLKKMSVSHLFTKYRRKAALAEDLSFHALRHTAASWLMMNGASIEAVRLYLGHSSITVTQKYAHLSRSVFAEQIHAAFRNVRT